MSTISVIFHLNFLSFSMMALLEVFISMATLLVVSSYSLREFLDAGTVGEDC